MELDIWLNYLGLDVTRVVRTRTGRILSKSASFWKISKSIENLKGNVHTAIGLFIFYRHEKIQVSVLFLHAVRFKKSPRTPKI